MEVDSIRLLMKNDYLHQIHRLDSSYNAMYLKQLERANEIQSGNNTYYSVLFGALAVVVTLLAFYIVVSYYNGKRLFDLNLALQRTEHDRQLKNNQDTFERVLDEQSKAISKLFAENKEVINELVKSTQSEFEAIKKKNSGTDSDTLAKMQEKIDRLQEMSNTSITSLIRGNLFRASAAEYVKAANQRVCIHCGAVTEFKNGIIDTNVVWICPKCHAANFA